jgi:hypothetical protein
MSKRHLSCCFLIYVLSLAGLPPLAKNQPKFETAKVISQNIDSKMIDKTFPSGIPIYLYTSVVVVETDSQRLTWEENEIGKSINRRVLLSPLGKDLMIFAVKATIQFYRDGGFYIVIDDTGNKHKLKLVHMEAIENGTQK